MSSKGAIGVVARPWGQESEGNGSAQWVSHMLHVHGNMVEYECDLEGGWQIAEACSINRITI